MSINFDELLEQARQGAPRSIFTPYMNELCDPQGFDNLTRLRLLGNAIANSAENAAVLAGNDAALEKLLTSDTLGLNVLYNGTINNTEFSEKVLHTMSSSPSALRPSPALKNLLGSIWESCEIPRSFLIKLVLNGFVELILQDPSLETEPEVVNNFKSIYEFCQQVSLEAEDADDFDTLGIRVIGNITSHQSFGLDEAREIGEEPFTWETVALLGNLSAEKRNVEPVLEKWPHIVDETVKLIESEDPEADSDAEDEAEMSDEDVEPPFDLELWGALLRNVARNFRAAQTIAKYNPSRLFTRLLSSPNTQTIASDFAAAFTANCYDHELTALLTSEPYNGGSALIVSSVVTGLVEHGPAPPSGEIDWALPRISTTLVEGLLADSNEGVWIKGTRALALLKAKFGYSDAATSRLVDKVPNASEPVQQNLKAIQ